MWIREYQRPWALGAIVAADHRMLKDTLLERLRKGGYRRAWMVVGGDRGWWREERLCLRRGGDWSFVLDCADGVTEPRVPAHPEWIASLEVKARAVIEREGISEGTLRAATPNRPGLLMLGVDVDQRAMYGLAGYRDLLELYWKIRNAGRLARGTGAG
jgi:hypothetical protein